MSGLNFVCLNDAVAITVGDDATGVATAGDVVEAGGAGQRAPQRGMHRSLDVLTGNGVDAPGDRSPITAVFRTTA